MDRNEKLQELFSSEEFKQEAANISTAEELQALFAKHGLELSIDEVISLCGQIAAQMGEVELSENELEDVAGGFGLVTVGIIALGVGCIGALAMGIYNGYIEAKRGK